MKKLLTLICIMLSMSTYTAISRVCAQAFSRSVTRPVMSYAAAARNLYKTTPNQTSLQQLLTNLSLNKGEVCSQLSLLKTPLTTISNKIAHQKLYALVLQTLANDKQKLQSIINQHALATGIDQSMLPAIITAQASTLSKWKNSVVSAMQKINPINYFKPTPAPTLYQELQSLAAHTEAVAPSVWPLKQVVESLKKRITDPVLLDATLHRLSVDKKGLLQKLIDEQIAQNQYAHEHAIYKGLQHSKHWLKRYYQDGQPRPIRSKAYQHPTSMYELLSNVSTHSGEVCSKIALVKTPLDTINNKIAHQKLYDIVLQTLAADKPKLQSIINQQSLNNGIVSSQLPKITTPAPSVLTQLKNFTTKASQAVNPLNYFKPTPAPTLYQELQKLAAHTGAVAPSVWPLKQVLENLKKRITDPALLDATLKRLSVDKKGLLQKLIDEQIAHNQYAHEHAIYKGLEHSKHWLKRYQEGMEYQHATTANALVPQSVIHPHEVTILPPTSSVTPYNNINKTHDYEINLADTLPTSTPSRLLGEPTKLLTTGNHHERAYKAFNAEHDVLHRFASYPIIPEPQKLLEAGNLPKLSYNQAQNALNAETNRLNHIAQQPVVPNSQIKQSGEFNSAQPSALQIIPEPQKLLEAGNLPKLSYNQAQNALNNEHNQLRHIAQQPNVPNSQIKQSDAFNPAQPNALQIIPESQKLLTEGNLPKLSYNQAQNALNNEHNQLRHIAQQPVVPNSQIKQSGEFNSAQPNALQIIPEPQKLLTEGNLPKLSYNQAQNALNNEHNQLRHIAQQPVVPNSQIKQSGEFNSAQPNALQIIPEPQKLLTEGNLPKLSYNQAQNALNAETNRLNHIAQQPVVPNSQIKQSGEFNPAQPSALQIIPEPQKLLTEGNLPKLSYNQAFNALNNEHNQLRHIAQQPVVPNSQIKQSGEFNPAQPSALQIIPEPQKLLTEGNLPKISYNQAYNALNTERDLLHQVAPQNIIHPSEIEIISAPAPIIPHNSTTETITHDIHIPEPFTPEPTQRSIVLPALVVTGAGAGSAYAYSQLQDDQPEQPTRSLLVPGLAATGVAAAIAVYKYLHPKQDDKAKEPSDKTEENDSENITREICVQEVAPQQDNTAPFDAFYSNHQTIGINSQLAQNIHHHGFSMADVYNSNMLQPEQKAQIVSMMHQKK